MLTAIAILLSVALVVWLVWRAVHNQPIRLHLVMNLLAALTSIFTIAFFMTMNIPTIAKVLAAIVIGGILIFLAARQQRREAEKASGK